MKTLTLTDSEVFLLAQILMNMDHEDWNICYDKMRDVVGRVVHAEINLSFKVFRLYNERFPS